MKMKCIYAMALIIIALGATSCGKHQVRSSEIEEFQEADIEDGPPCGCEDASVDENYIRNIRLYHTPTVI